MEPESLGSFPPVSPSQPHSAHHPRCTLGTWHSQPHTACPPPAPRSCWPPSQKVLVHWSSNSFPNGQDKGRVPPHQTPTFCHLHISSTKVSCTSHFFVVVISPPKSHCRKWLIQLGHSLDREPLGHVWDGRKDPPPADRKPSCVTRGHSLRPLPHSTLSCVSSPAFLNYVEIVLRQSSRYYSLTHCSIGIKCHF